MRDRGRSKNRERKQCFIRDCAYLTDGLQAGRKQRVLYLRWEPDFADWDAVRQLWRWVQLAHFPFAFSAAFLTPITFVCKHEKQVRICLDLRGEC